MITNFCRTPALLQVALLMMICLRTTARYVHVIVVTQELLNHPRALWNLIVDLKIDK